MPRNLLLVLTLFTYLAGVAGYSYDCYRTERAEQIAAIDERLRAAAQGAVAVLGRDYHDRLDALRKSPRDEQVKVASRLHGVANALGVTYLYTFVQDEGRIAFAADAAVDEVTRDGLFKPYDEATPALKKSFSTMKPFYEEATDKWGSFRSALLPMRSPSGRVFVVGADMSMTIVLEKTRRALFKALGTALFFVILVGMIAAVYIVTLRSANRSLETLVRQRTSHIETLVNQTKKYLPPQLYSQIVGGRKDIGSQRRVKLTVFFSDVKGFTETTDQLEAEDLATLLNTYLAEMSKIAIQYGGTIDKYVGDAIMVFFGAPEATNDADHASRCIRMAIDMRERLVDLRAIWAEQGQARPLHVRMGISTGYCTVGNFGSEYKMDYTAIGSIVNLASRLENAADPDTVLISHETYMLVKDMVEVEDNGELLVKGISFPVRSWRLTALREHRVKTHFLRREGGFELAPIVFKDGVTSEAQRVMLAESLRLALASIEETQNFKKAA